VLLAETHASNPLLVPANALSCNTTPTISRPLCLASLSSLGASVLCNGLVAVFHPFPNPHGHLLSHTIVSGDFTRHLHDTTPATLTRPLHVAVPGLATCTRPRRAPSTLRVAAPPSSHPDSDVLTPSRPPVRRLGAFCPGGTTDRLTYYRTHDTRESLQSTLCPPKRSHTLPCTTWPLPLQALAALTDGRLRCIQRSWIPTRPWASSRLRPQRRPPSSLPRTLQPPPSRPCASTPPEASASATPRNTLWPTCRPQSRYARSTSIPAASSRASRRRILRQANCKRYAYCGLRHMPITRIPHAEASSVSITLTNCLILSTKFSRNPSDLQMGR
jgi:hypothetical protein